MKSDSIFYVGLDLHKESIVAACAVDRGGPGVWATSASWREN